MQDIDLSGVDPRRWPEIRRRIDAIQGYIALGRRDGARRDEYAAQLGISPMMFLSLVKAWKEHGDAVRLSGSGLDRGRPRAARSLPEATRIAIEEAISALGTDARHVDVVAEANRRCDAAGTKRASSGMVQHLLMRARRDAVPKDGKPAILVGRVVCKLPVRIGTEVVVPDLMVAVMSPEGAILAHEIAGGEGEAERLSKLLSSVEGAGTAGCPKRELVIPATLHAARETISGRHATTGPTAGRIANLLGAGIGMVDIAHRRKATTGAPSDGSPMNAPLTLSEAREAVAVAVGSHNASRGGIACFDLAPLSADPDEA